MATNGSFAQQEQYTGTSETSGTAATIDKANAAGRELTKDEVGWYFVEQYYTTLSKNNDRLHVSLSLFHPIELTISNQLSSSSTTSPLSSSAVLKPSPSPFPLDDRCVDILAFNLQPLLTLPLQAIQQRIKELDFQSAKVRVSNVDCQGSFDNILVQVIGEISNKNEVPKKFVQAFVLAQQPSGFYVLNDIFRYIDEEETAEASGTPAADEELAAKSPAEVTAEAEAAPAPVEDAPKEEPTSVNAQEVEQKLEEVSAEDVSGSEVESPEAEKPAAKVEEVDYDAAAQELAAEDANEAEKPVDPAPTPAVEKAAPKAAPVPEKPAVSAPKLPMTWASRAAAAAGPRPVVPLPKTAAASAQSQVRAPAPAATPQSSAGAAKSNGGAPAAESASKDNSEWQTAGADSKRQARPTSVSAPPADKEGTLGYVKYVTDKVHEDELKKVLEAHGELAYFDVNRSKNCAFVEYKAHEGLTAALAGNPHIVQGEQILIEQRRPKSTAYGGANFAGGRGGAQRGRGGFDGRSGGPQGGARGNYGGQNRGRAPRGRGGAQATNA